MSLKDEIGSELITSEVKSLFSSQKIEISVDDLLDEKGNIKTGLKLFDLNGDNKFDEKEKAYFTSQGKIIGEKDVITLGDFIVILDKLQLFDASKGRLTNSEREELYHYVDSVFAMLDGLNGMSGEIKELYEKALSTISAVGIETQRSSAKYYSYNKSIKLNSERTDKYTLASTIKSTKAL